MGEVIDLIAYKEQKQKKQEEKKRNSCQNYLLNRCASLDAVETFLFLTNSTGTVSWKEIEINDELYGKLCKNSEETPDE